MEYGKNIQNKPTIYIKGLKGQLYDYQKYGVEFLNKANGRAILADSMGIGKSVQALGYIVFNDIKRTLVISPASAKFVWENEVAKWTNLKSYIVNSNTKFSEIPHNTNVIIVNYDILKRHFNELMKYKWDLLVADEWHKLKSSRAIRTKLTKSIATNIPRVILLSGTPMLNRPIELFNGLNIIDPKTWNNWFKFSIRYANGHRGRFGWDSSGASNVEELRSKILPYFLRRTKTEVLTELPSKNNINIPIELSPDIQQRYNQAEEDLGKFLMLYKKKTLNDIKKMLSAQKLVKLTTLRQIITEGKLKSAIEIIDQLLDNQEKVVVFSVFNAPLEALKKHYNDISVILTGKTSNVDRGLFVQQFQNNPNIKLFLGGTKSSGEAITLTAASSLIHIDFDWTPGIMDQASDRINRIGQKAQSISIYQIYAKNTIDDYMVKLLNKKQGLIDQLIEGRELEEKEESIINTIFDNLERKYEK